jgi:hypothetical protein
MKLFQQTFANGQKGQSYNTENHHSEPNPVKRKHFAAVLVEQP